jgi:uncharacterized glyoxalase superfamily protein PhnB
MANPSCCASVLKVSLALGFGLGVDDADALFAEFSANGVPIRTAPQNFSWAYEFSVEDPDGHVLRFGAEPKSGAD